jgi:HlyD family secretion protein
MRRSLLILIVLGLFVLAGSYALLRGRHASENAVGAGVASGETPPPATSQVVALGTLQPKGGVIEVGGTVGERLESYKVEAGQMVKQGDPLAILESYRVRDVQLQTAELALQEAKRRQAIEQNYGDSLVAEAKLGLEALDLDRLDLAVQQSKIKLLEANLALVKRDQGRMQKLDDSIVSPQERDHQNLLVEQAQAELDSAQAVLTKSRAGHDFNVRDSKEKLKSAEANRSRLLGAIDLESVAKSVELAKAQLELSIIRAPADGRVLEVVTRPGESVGQQPILRLGDTDHMYAVAEVYETQVFEIAPGQRATVTSQALRKSLSGTVERVGTMIAKNDVLSLNPTNNSDLRVVKVRIRLDDSQEAARLVNLQATIAIDTAPSRSSSPPGGQAPKK